MKKLLFVIDYQADFVNGALGFPGADKLDEGIARKVHEYGPGRVYFTRDTHSQEYLSTQEGCNLPVEHCLKGSGGWQVYGETRKALEEVQAVGIDKVAFGMSPEQLLALPDPAEVEAVELIGLVSNICVLSNAVLLKSRYPEAKLSVDETLTASFDPALHDAALMVLKGIQVDVI
jgi:nicotinamidase-related amidase